jgi:hypothetical protein
MVSCFARVPEHQVGVGAHGHGALARVEAEELGGRVLLRSTNWFRSMRPVPTPWCTSGPGGAGCPAAPLGILRKSWRPAILLAALVEGAVVGGHVWITPAARASRAPPGGPGADRRAHHVGRALEIGFVVDGVVEEEVLRAGLAVDGLAAQAGADDRVHGFAAGDMHDVDRHPGHAGQQDRAAVASPSTGSGRLRAWYRGVHLAFGEQLALQGQHQAVLAVGGDQGAQLAGAVCITWISSLSSMPMAPL